MMDDDSHVHPMIWTSSETGDGYIMWLDANGDVQKKTIKGLHDRMCLTWELLFGDEE